MDGGRWARLHLLSSYTQIWAVEGAVSHGGPGLWQAHSPVAMMAIETAAFRNGGRVPSTGRSTRKLSVSCRKGNDLFSPHLAHRWIGSERD